MVEKTIHRESASQERSEKSFLHKPYLSKQKPRPSSGLSLPWLRPKATHLSGFLFPTLKHTIKSLKVSLAPKSQDKPNRSRFRMDGSQNFQPSCHTDVSIFETDATQRQKGPVAGRANEVPKCPPARSRRDALACPANEACSRALTLPAAKGEALR